MNQLESDQVLSSSEIKFSTERFDVGPDLWRSEEVKKIRCNQAVWKEMESQNRQRTPSLTKWLQVKKKHM
jgi:hypothetical protein